MPPRPSPKQGKTGVSTVSSASFFGSQHEMYLPRLVIDLDLIDSGLGVQESHESPLQHTIWGAMNLSSRDEQIAAFVRMAIVLSCGLPAALALPLEEPSEVEGSHIDMNVSPFKVFPSGDIKSSITSKFTSEKTLFSRVLMHIPGDMLHKSPLLRATVTSFNKGLLPPVFSRAALGQMFLALGEKFTLPQPDASLLTMKLAQHLSVVVTSRSAPVARMSHGLNLAYPSRFGPLLQASTSVFKFLESKFGRRIPAAAFKVFFARVAVLFDCIVEEYPRHSPQFDQFTFWAIAAMERFWAKAKADRTEFAATKKSLKKHETALLADLPPDAAERTALQRSIANIKESIDIVSPRADTNEEEMKSLVVRGGNLAAVYLFSEEMWTHRRKDTFKKLIAETYHSIGVEKPPDFSISVSLFLSGLASGQYHFMFPEKQSLNPFLWLYAGALPAVDTAVLSCVRACIGAIMYPPGIPFMDNTNGVEVATCVQMWRDGLLESLKADNTRENNQKLLAVARKQCPITVVNIDHPGSVFFPIAVRALENGHPLIFLSHGVGTDEAWTFFSHVINLVVGRSTRRGQVLRFNDGRYRVRVKTPLHNMRIYIAMPAAYYRARNTFLDCRPMKPTLTLQILDVFQRACPEGDIGPFQEAALKESAAHKARQQYWHVLRDMSRQLITLKPGSASADVIRSGSALLDLAQEVQTTQAACANQWVRRGIDYGLAMPIRMVESHFRSFPAPILRGAATVEKQMVFLTERVSEFVLDKGFTNLTPPSVAQLFSDSLGRLVASTVAPNVLFEMGQFQVLMLLYNLINLLMRGDFDTATCDAAMYAMSHNWKAVKGRVDTKYHESLLPVLKTRGTPLSKHALLKSAFERLSWLESSAPVFHGVCASILECDEAFAEAILLVNNIDAGTELLSYIIGNTPKREYIMGQNHHSKDKLRLPEMLGTVLCDGTLAKNYTVLCCLNPASALVSMGAWMRAFSSAKYIQMGQDNIADFREKNMAAAQQLKMPRMRVQVHDMVNTLRSSSKAVAIGVMCAPVDAFPFLHVTMVLSQAGMQPVYGLFNHMPPERVAVVLWDTIKEKKPTDRVFHQPVKMVVIMPRHAEKQNPDLAQFLVGKSIYQMCLRVQRDPVRAAYTKIPGPAWMGLSPTPHFLTPTPGIPAFVSPAFSAAMQRMYAGVALTFAQKQYHPSFQRRGAGMEWFISVTICVRQVSTLARFMVHYGQDASHIYSRPPLQRVTAKSRLARGPARGGRSRDSDVRFAGHLSLSNDLIEKCQQNPATDMFRTWSWPSQFQSGVVSPLNNMAILRYLRLLTDTICYEGPSSYLTQVQVELPCHAGHLLDSYDLLKVSDGHGTQRTGLTAKTGVSMASRQQSRSKYGESMHSARSGMSNSSYMQPAGSVIAGSEAGSQATSHVGRRNHGRGQTHRVAQQLTQALECIADTDNVRIALLSPDAPLVEKLSVPAQLPDIRGMLSSHNKVFAQDPAACLASDFFGVVPLQYSVDRPSILEDIRDLLESLTAPSDARKRAIAASKAKRGGRSRSRDDERYMDVEMDMDSHNLIEIVHSLTSCPKVVAAAHKVLASNPLADWCEDPCDISGLSQDAKRALLFSLMVEFANNEGIRQADCHFVCSMTPPLSMDRSRDAPAVQLKAKLVNFRLSADMTTPVSASYHLPPACATVYIHCDSDKRRSHGRGAIREVSNVSSESELSLLQDQQSSGMIRVSQLKGGVPGLGHIGEQMANVPVILGSRRLGNVSLRDKIGADHWISMGAHFDIM
ncbi:hypothetical protein KIPB_000318 [Kipferlia bialata]|uniref:Uncharacterized protein n=1 Tax=Kipferlia bialata TaxID=797122 RepID=A0A9K3GEV4_9EUKA|nr:hypothetical protein KIPB_000318 [Kipferlia bialata]|eukprot:g318.t1